MAPGGVGACRERESEMRRVRRINVGTIVPMWQIATFGLFLFPT